MLQGVVGEDHGERVAHAIDPVVIEHVILEAQILKKTTPVEQLPHP